MDKAPRPKPKIKSCGVRQNKKTGLWHAYFNNVLVGNHPLGTWPTKEAAMAVRKQAEDVFNRYHPSQAASVLAKFRKELRRAPGRASATGQKGVTAVAKTGKFAVWYMSRSGMRLYLGRASTLELAKQMQEGAARQDRLGEPIGGFVVKKDGLSPGIKHDKKHNNYRVQVAHSGRVKYLGTFDNLPAAFDARQAERVKVGLPVEPEPENVAAARVELNRVKDSVTLELEQNPYDDVV